MYDDVVRMKDNTSIWETIYDMPTLLYYSLGILAQPCRRTTAMSEGGE